MRLLGLPVLLFLMLLAVTKVEAIEFTVNSTVDAVDANPGDGACSSTSGACTLRAAIQEANALAGSDTVKLPEGHYVLSLVGSSEFASATGSLDITDSLTLAGTAEAANTIIDADNIDRVFFISNNAGEVAFSKLTIKNGNSSGSGGGGGGIYNFSNLSVDHCIITANDANGGAANGGGIFNGLQASLSMTLSTISNNKAANVGGGIAHTAGSNSLEIRKSVIFGNQATGGQGGGIYIDTTGLIESSTIANNSCLWSGAGGIHADASELVEIKHSTIVDNLGGQTGGVSGNSETTLINTLVASNESTSDGGGPDCKGSITSQGYNLISDTTNCAIAGTTGDQFDLDAGLDAFTDDGVPGSAHVPLLADSPALNAGDDSVCVGDLATDQLGNPHVGVCDIGAVEFGACGDGVVQLDEDCDDGNELDGDGCDSACNTLCGDGVVAGDEACDDGNTVNGDGCDGVCQSEPADEPAVPVDPVDADVPEDQAESAEPATDEDETVDIVADEDEEDLSNSGSGDEESTVPESDSTDDSDNETVDNETTSENTDTSEDGGGCRFHSVSHRLTSDWFHWFTLLLPLVVLFSSRLLKGYEITKRPR